MINSIVKYILILFLKGHQQHTKKIMNTILALKKMLDQARPFLNYTEKQNKLVWPTSENELHHTVSKTLHVSGRGDSVTVRQHTRIMRTHTKKGTNQSSSHLRSTRQIQKAMTLGYNPEQYADKRRFTIYTFKTMITKNVTRPFFGW